MANPYFNTQYYLDNNPDVLAAGVDPEQHYHDYGASEALAQGAQTRRPAPWFDIQYYLAENPDVAQHVAGNVGAAFDHFTEYGIAEGRQPSADYDLNEANLGEYARNNPDLLEAYGIEDPDNLTDEQQYDLANHYYQYGWNEGRPADPGIPEGGDSHDLTTERDVIDASGEHDNTFNAPLSASSDGNILRQTLNSDDVLTGGTGWDVLNAELNGVDRQGSGYNPALNDINELNLTARPGGNEGAGATLSLSRASGYEVINNVGSRANLRVEDVNAQNGAPTLGLHDVRGSSADPEAGDTTIVYDGLQAEAITQDIVADTVGLRDASFGSTPDLTIEGAEVDTINLEASGGVYLNLLGAAGEVQNLNISGSDEVELGNVIDGDEEAAGNFANLVNLDAGEHDGGLRIDVSGSDVLETVVTGAGDDLVVVGAAALSEDNSASIDLGDGDDILAVTGVADADAIAGLNFSGGVAGVETLSFADAVDLADDAELDLDGVDDDLNTIRFEQGITGDEASLSFVNEGSDLSIEAGVNEEDGTGFDIATAINTDNAENLVVATGADGNIDLGRVAGDELQTITLSADQGTIGATLDGGDAEDEDGGLLGNLDTVTVLSGQEAGDDADAEGNPAANLTLAGDLANFTTLDLTGVQSSFNVDASAAEYDQDQVVYMIADVADGIITAEGGVSAPPPVDGGDGDNGEDGGDGDNGDNGEPVLMQAEAAIGSQTEVFQFVGEEANFDITIENFDFGGQANHDLIDLSAYDLRAQHLNFDADGGDMVITAEGYDDFQITLAGLGDVDSGELLNHNIIL